MLEELCGLIVLKYHSDFSRKCTVISGNVLMAGQPWWPWGPIGVVSAGFLSSLVATLALRQVSWERAFFNGFFFF